MNLNKINKIHLSLAFGIGITGLFFVIATSGFWLAEHIPPSVVSQCLEGVGIIGVLLLLPGAPFGLLAFNPHGNAFLPLSLVGDVAVYSFVAYKFLKYQQRKTKELSDR